MRKAALGLVLPTPWLCRKWAPQKIPLSFFSAESPSKGSLIIYDIMDEIMGKKFSPQDPDDGTCRNCWCKTNTASFPDCWVIEPYDEDDVWFSLVIFGWLFWESRVSVACAPCCFSLCFHFLSLSYTLPVSLTGFLIMLLIWKHTLCIVTKALLNFDFSDMFFQSAMRVVSTISCFKTFFPPLLSIS